MVRSRGDDTPPRRPKPLKLVLPARTPGEDILRELHLKDPAYYLALIVLAQYRLQELLQQSLTG